MNEMTLQEGIETLLEEMKNHKGKPSRFGTFTIIGYTKESFKYELKDKLKMIPDISFTEVDVMNEDADQLHKKVKLEDLKLVGFYKLSYRVDNRHTYMHDFEEKLRNMSSLVVGVTSQGMFVNKNYYGDANVVLEEEKIVELLK